MRLRKRSDTFDTATPALARYYFRRSYARLVLLAICAYCACWAIWYLRDIAPAALETDFSQAILPEHFPFRPLRKYSGTNALDIDDSYVYKRSLGSGFEGSASLYEDQSTGEDVVIKSYHSTRFRDLMPVPFFDHFLRRTLYWPTEVPASLFVSTISSDYTSGAARDTLVTGYVPMLDYFLASTGGIFFQTSWHFVTPFFVSGTLEQLAASIRKEGTESPSSLDAQLRPSLTKMLSSLRAIHERGYCHDDIKMDNVFAINRTTWLLGDLGNMREIGHPFHQTHEWTRKNQWTDCRLNDVRRTLKTYLGVLRNAASAEALFDEHFYQEQQPWSSLYWNYIRNPVPAETLVRMQEEGYAPQRPENMTEVCLTCIHAARQVAITRELKCTKLKMTPRQWWRLGAFWSKYEHEVNKAWW